MDQEDLRGLIEMESFIPVLTPIIGLVGAILLALLSVTHKSRRAADTVFLSTTIVTAVMTGYVAYTVLRFNETLVYGSGGWLPPLGIVYVVDKLSATMALLSSLIIFLIAVYSIGYFGGREHGIHYLYILVLLMSSALIGIYYTGDLFNFFVMIELMAVTAYALVGYHKNKGEAVEAALKYGMIACLAGILLFLGIGFIYAYIGTLSIPDLSAKILGLPTPMNLFSGNTVVAAAPLLLIVGLIVWSLMLESAAFPLHFWLPDAHSEAPSPVSALLSGLVVNAGLYGLIRLFYTVLSLGRHAVGGLSVVLDVLVVLGCLGALYASVMMLIESDIKRIIAYSTVMHVSLIIIGISIGTRYALAASIYHFITHSISKALAFLSVGVLVSAAGTRNIRDLKGFAKLYPGASAGMIIAMLGLAGVPPLGTFPSKLLLIAASVGAGNIGAALIIIVTSAIAAIGYFRIINLLVNEAPVKTGVLRPGWTVKASITILCILVVVVGLALPLLSQLSTSVSGQLFSPTDYIGSVRGIIERFLTH